MKRKWLKRFAALCIAAMLCLPVYAEEPLKESASEATAEPETTPVETEVPETIEPVQNLSEESATPAETEAPAETEIPVETETPIETSEPELAENLEGEAPEDSTASPDPSVTPDDSTAPDASATPSASATAAPESTDSPEGESTETPETSQMPEASASPEATEPVETAAPETSPSPESSVTPEPSATPEPPTELVHGDFTFKINADGALTLVAWVGAEESVSVPGEAEARSVVSIAASAFAGNETVREISVPAGVISIESGAFADCTGLREINLPDSLERTGELFSGCGALEVVRLNVANEIVMNSARGYEREIVEVVDESEQKRNVSVMLDSPFTDITVLDGGCLNVDGAMLVEKDHVISVLSGGVLAISESGSITVLGMLVCEGNASNAGSVVACAGDVSGIENVNREHSWQAHECAVCGALQTILLDVEVLRESFDKTYDGMDGVAIAAEDFELLGVLEGDDVFIAAINSDFNKRDVGSYLVNVGFVLAGEDAGRYGVKQVEISATIHPKRVTVTPRSGQGKVYGEKDPTLSAGYKGTVKGEILQGALSREKGESAGKYKILAGTLERMNPNYEIVLSDAYFEISRKSMSDGDIQVGKVSNQRHSGDEIEPSVEIRDGSVLLKEGSDYSVIYSNNVSVGTAQVEIVGMGNYSGSRTVTFQIIKVSSSAGDSGLSGSGNDSAGASLEALNDFGSVGTLIDEDTPVSTDTLTVGGRDLGSILFDVNDQPLTFVQSERMLADGEDLFSILTITAEELLNDFDIPLEGEYGQPRMRLSMDMIRAMQTEGYTHIELIVGEAEMRIPLNTLYAEFVSIEGTLSVDCYEARLWQMKDEELLEPHKLAVEDCALLMQPVHFELLAIPKVSEGEEAVPVDVLSLLDGVQLLFAPENVPDYENTPHVVVCVDVIDPETRHEPEGARFILDGDTVKSCLQPLFGGMYALAAK